MLFAWLVTMVPRGSPQMVGVARMTLMLPGTLLILVGGSYADRIGGRRAAMLAQLLAAAAPLILLGLVAAGRLTFGGMLDYAFVMGCAQAFVTPARDGLLNQVAGGRAQRSTSGSIDEMEPASRHNCMDSTCRRHRLPSRATLGIPTAGEFSWD